MADTTGAGTGTDGDGAIDEVAYKLEDWDDESFVEAEEALRVAGVTFRREGLDTLVVGPDDEEAVDTLLDAVESRRAAEAGVEQGEVGEAGEVAESADGSHEELIYELVEWSPEMRNQLSLVLDRDGIVHEWEGDDLVVAAAVEAQVDDLIDQIEQGDELVPAAEDVDDEAEYNLLSDLFVAADRLSNNPSDLALCGDLVDASAPTESMPVPFGVDETTWHLIRQQAAALVGAIETEEPDTTIGERAGVLAELLRSLV